MRFRPQDYQYRRRIEAVVEPAPQGPVLSFGIWLLTPIVTGVPMRWLVKLFGANHIQEIEEETL